MFDFFIHEFDVFVDELAHLGLIPEDWDPLAAPTHEAIPDPVHTDPNWQIHDPTQDPIFHGDFHLDNPHVDPNVPTEQVYTDHPTETHLSDGSTTRLTGTTKTTRIRAPSSPRWKSTKH